MITTFLSLYLVFIILVSLAVAALVYRLKLPSSRLLVTGLVIFIVSPLLAGFFYLSYFGSLPEVIVSDVTGYPLEAARQKLEESGLRVREAGTIYEMKYPPGYIVSQRPEGGRTVKAGRLINLMISSGESKVIMPNLLGRNLAEAPAILSAAQFNLGDVRFEKNDSVPPGTILAQEPLPGEQAPAGSRVDMITATNEGQAEKLPPEQPNKEEEKNLWLRLR